MQWPRGDYLGRGCLDPSGALENAIHENNVDDVKAEVIVEGANAPTSPDAHEALVQREDRLEDGKEHRRQL